MPRLEILGVHIGDYQTLDDEHVETFQVSGFNPYEGYVGKIAPGVVSFDFVSGVFKEWGDGLECEPEEKPILNLFK